MKAIALGVSLTLASAIAVAASDCKFTRVAELPVRAGAEKLVVDGAINGNRVGVALDTGARSSRIAGSAADRLGLVQREAAGLYVVSNGAMAVDTTSITDFRLGGSVMKGWGKLIVEGTEGRDYAVVLGHDFFEQVDVEFDLAHNAVRLFQPQGCGDATLAYWAPRDAGHVALERDTRRPAMLIPVKLNGKPALAALASGAAYSLIDESLARALASPLETFALGDELVRNPTLRTADLGYRDILLGLDFLRAHRVLVSNSQGRVYFTYAGGRVFQTAR